MTYETFGTLKSDVRSEMDLIDEPIVTDTDLQVFAKEAIQLVHADILGIAEDYFLTYKWITMVQGTSDYDLPSDIFAQKIRRLVYINGLIIYPIRRIQGRRLFEAEAHITVFGASVDYRYMLRNDSDASNCKIELLPAAREGGNLIKCWYDREPAIPSADSDKIDIPEFYTLIKAYVKLKVATERLKIPEVVQDVKSEVDMKRTLLVETLQGRVPDDDNLVELDMDFYWEHN